MESICWQMRFDRCDVLRATGLGRVSGRSEEHTLRNRRQACFVMILGSVGMVIKLDFLPHCTHGP
ncbi:MAG: hypothetical protein NTV17_13920, partial [Burkholderiales bacterium]|nr:hypothetical protein [Burkholderiales bacterium]